MKQIQFICCVMLGGAVALFSGCRTFSDGLQEKNLHAVIFDLAGTPIEGALFYAEAYTHETGVFDFVFAVSGSRGEVPATEDKPLTIEWRSGARLALTAFAHNRKPIVIYSQSANIAADGIAFHLDRLPRPGLRWEPRLGHLGFPFENNPSLANRVSQPDHKALRAAFRQAYAPLEFGEESAVPREWNKLDFLKSMAPAQ